MGFLRPTEPFLKNLAWQTQAANALQYNTSQPGSVIPLVLGTVRQQVNLLDLQNYQGPNGKKGKVGPLPLGGTNPYAGSFGGFAQTKKATKAGGPYSVDVLFGLCEGPASDNGGSNLNPDTGGNNAVYTNAQVAQFGAVGLNFYPGTVNQGADPTFVGYGHIVGYSGTVIITGTPMELGSSPVLPNLSVEVNGYDAGTGGPNFPVDANPGNAITTVLTDPAVGIGFPAANLDNLMPDGSGTYGDYCQAAQLAISVSLDTQQKAGDLLDGLAKLTNSAVFWSGELLRITPYGDLALSANGASWTPDLVPVYSLTDDDFLPWHPHQEGEEPRTSDDDPIIVTRGNLADAVNWLTIQYRDRNSYYDPNIIAVFDQGSIDAYGRRSGDNLPGKAFCNATSAQVAAQLYLQRSQYVRNTYKFQIGWKYCRLEQMDIVLLTGRAGDAYLVKQPVRVISIEENPNGNLTVEAEEIQVGYATPQPTPTVPLALDGATNGRIVVPLHGGTPNPPYGLPTIVDATGTFGPLTTTQPNDFLIVFVSSELPDDLSHTGPASVVSISGAGLTWARRGYFTPPGSIDSTMLGNTWAKIELWYAVAPSPLGGANFTITFDQPVRSAIMCVFAVSGVNLANPWATSGPVTAYNAADNLSPTLWAVPGLSTNVANSFVFGCFAGYTNPVLAYAIPPQPWGYIYPDPNTGTGTSVQGFADAEVGVAGANLLGSWNQAVGDYQIFSTEQSNLTVPAEGSIARGASWIGIADALRGMS